jgi:hypothetical protein
MRYLCLLALFITPLLCGQGRLVWQDEFDGSTGASPDPAKWTYDLGAGGLGNDELETYRKSNANITQDGQGHLIIRATKNGSGGYDSARIKTQGRFSFIYGRAEARMKLPSGQGMWPAFWMLGDDIKSAGWPNCGEIDVMENIGREPRIVHGTVNGPGYSAGHGISAPFTFPEDELPSDGFHVYAVNWTARKIEFLVDGSVYQLRCSHCRRAQNGSSIIRSFCSLTLRSAGPGQAFRTTRRGFRKSCWWTGCAYTKIKVAIKTKPAGGGRSWKVDP